MINWNKLLQIENPNELMITFFNDCAVLIDATKYLWNIFGFVLLLVFVLYNSNVSSFSWGFVLLQ